MSTRKGLRSQVSGLRKINRTIFPKPETCCLAPAFQREGAGSLEDGVNHPLKAIHRRRK